MQQRCNFSSGMDRLFFVLNTVHQLKALIESFPWIPWSLESIQYRPRKRTSSLMAFSKMRSRRRKCHQGGGPFSWPVLYRFKRPRYLRKALDQGFPVVYRI